MLLAGVLVVGGAVLLLPNLTTQLEAQGPEDWPALLFEETWQRNDAALGVPTSPRRGENPYYLAGQSAVTNPDLELTLYGAKAADIAVYEFEGHTNLWTGLTNSPVAVTLRHRTRLLDLTGFARMSAITRSNNLHVLRPVIALADGTLLVGSQAVDNGPGMNFRTVDVAFANQAWYLLDPVDVSVGNPVADVDLSRVDQVGFADLSPSGGHGNSGWSNIGPIQVYATGVPR
jgi:hypothetical protein